MSEHPVAYVPAPISPALADRRSRVILAREGNVIPIRSGEPWKYCGRCGLPMAWYRLARKVFRRATGEQVQMFAWECPRYTAGEAGNERHDQMSRHVYDPSLPVAETT